MNLQLFDTYERKVRPFEPLVDNKVGIYACGPTVYNFAHIGNLRTYLFEDILIRVLVANGYDVNHIINITDVGHLTS
ncbi:MAG: cysteine--tRNA ligase, partial [Gammaproteobacteria bacterium]|nr:cysteine--tRNA ligase [Gammaproteobacteria bacterium]